MAETLRNVKARDLRKHIPQNIERELIDKNINIIGMLSKANQELNEQSMRLYNQDEATR